MTRTTTGENTILNQQPRTPTAQPASCPPTAVQLRDHPWVARSVGLPLSSSSVYGEKMRQQKAPQHRSWRWCLPFPMSNTVECIRCRGIGTNSVLSLIKLGALLKLLKTTLSEALDVRHLGYKLILTTVLAQDHCFSDFLSEQLANQRTAELR